MPQNFLYPGRPNYEGPTTGLFGLLHHDTLVEWSHNVMERVEYVKRYKPENEVEIRLWNMCYLSEERLPKEFVEAWKTFGEAGKTYEEAWETYEEAWETCMEVEKIYGEVSKTYEEALKTCVEALKIYDEAENTWKEAWNTYNKALQIFSPQILDLIKELVPDTAWNGQELIFT